MIVKLSIRAHLRNDLHEWQFSEIGGGGGEGGGAGPCMWRLSLNTVRPDQS
jgi:hypothetical protein